MSKRFMAALLAALFVSGCQNVKETMGVGRHSPDEFTVVKRAPLSLPPDYSLRPPATTAPPAQTQAPLRAQTVVLGNESARFSDKAGTSEERLLARLGAAQADPAIRDVIAEENGYLALKNRKTIEKLIFWQQQEPNEARLPVSEIDAVQEAARLKENKEKGLPPNEGDVRLRPQPKDGTLDKLF